MLINDLECSTCVFADAVDFEAIADDAWVMTLGVELCICIRCAPLDHKLVKYFTIPCFFFEDGESAESRLRSLQTQHRKKLLVVIDRDTSALIMILLIERIIGDSGTADDIVLIAICCGCCYCRVHQCLYRYSI